jgi:hypothetical protein
VTTPTETPSDLETPETRTYHLRGHEITITEMPSAGHDEAMRAAAAGQEDGKVDMPILERLLAVGSVKIDGQPLDAEKWGRYPSPVTQRITADVKEVHWMNLETDEEREAREKAARAAAKAAEEDGRKAPKDVPLPNS